MRYHFTEGFTKNLEFIPRVIQQKFWKQLSFLLKNPRHPSLNTKKYDEAKRIWQARVDRSYRFYFLIEKDIYTLLDIGPHPK